MEYLYFFSSIPIGTLGNQWNQAVVNIVNAQNFQLVFEGVRGISYRGDIALDDITYSYQPCPTGSSKSQLSVKFSMKFYLLKYIF